MALAGTVVTFLFDPSSNTLKILGATSFVQEILSCRYCGFTRVRVRCCSISRMRMTVRRVRRNPTNNDLPGNDGPEQFVRLKLLGQGDQPALLPGSNVQAAAGDDFQQVDFRDR
jgi:hypothetical protein